MRVRSSLRRAFPYLVILSFLYWLNYYFTSPIASTKSLIDLAQPIQLNCTITPVIPSSHDSITCTVDDLAPLSCLKSDQEVYFPFSFLKKHLDVSGKIKGSFILPFL